MARLLALLEPHLADVEGAEPGAIDAVLAALVAAHTQGLRDAAAFCRDISTAARRHGEVAKALAEGIETLAKQADAPDVTRQRQAGS